LEVQYEFSYNNFIILTKSKYTIKHSSQEEKRNDLSKPVADIMWNLSGNVISDGGSVAGASIIIAGTTIGTTSDESGRFILKNILAGTYSLLISHIGYANLRKKTSNDFMNHQLTCGFNKKGAFKFTSLNSVIIEVKPGLEKHKFYTNEVWGLRINKQDFRLYNGERFMIEHIDNKVCIYRSEDSFEIPSWPYFIIDLDAPVYKLSRKQLIDAFYTNFNFIQKLMELPRSHSIYKWDAKKKKYEFVSWLH
jgi:hypothetical protein